MVSQTLIMSKKYLNYQTKTTYFQTKTTYLTWLSPVLHIPVKCRQEKWIEQRKRQGREEKNGMGHGGMRGGEAMEDFN
jgi:hypothetical protein